MKKILFITIILLLSGTSIAQRVVPGNRAIIDCRNMNPRAITTTEKARSTTATSTASVQVNDASDIASEVSNRTVSYYFEVTLNDISGSTSTLTWLNSIRTCDNYASGDSDNRWRLPTQRELALILIMHETLKAKVANFTAFNEIRNYWSATELNITNSKNAYYINFAIGGRMVSISKSQLHLLRCVRDLTPPK